MTSNYVLNNILTYRDRRLTGVRFFAGLASFYGICSLGAVANVGVASAAFGHHYTWWLSGLAGAAVDAVWNYAVSSVFTWRRRGTSPNAPHRGVPRPARSASGSNVLLLLPVLSQRLRRSSPPIPSTVTSGGAILPGTR